MATEQQLFGAIGAVVDRWLESVETGERFLTKEDCAEMIYIYKMYLKSHPQDAEIWVQLSYSYLRMLEISLAKDASRKAIQCRPTLARGYRSLAKIYWVLEQCHDEKLVIETALEKVVDEKDRTILLELQQKNHESIQRRNRYQKMLVTMKNPSKSGGYEFFGGLRKDRSSLPMMITTREEAELEGVKTPIPKQSFYAQLPRPIKSSFMESVWKKTQKEAKDFHSKEVVNEEGKNKVAMASKVMDTFCNGDVLFKWLEEDGTFLLEACLPDDDSHPIITITIKRNDDENVKYDYSYVRNEKVNKSLTSEQKDDLHHLTEIRFFRSIGSALSEDMLLYWCHHSIALFKSEKKHKHEVDYGLIRCDLLYNIGRITAQDIARLGEILESAKRYRDAAHIYLDLANHLHPTIDYEDCPGTTVHGFAALAFKRDMDYVAAESEYVASLRAVKRDWTWNSESQHEHRNLLNTIIFYIAVDRAFTAGVKADQQHSDIRRCGIIFCALLSNAGFNDATAAALEAKLDMHVDPFGGPFGENEWLLETKKRLDPKYKNAKKARQALTKAISKSTCIEDYRETLFSCENPHAPELNSRAMLGPDEAQGFLKEEKSMAKYGARKMNPKFQAGGFFYSVEPDENSDLPHCDHCGVKAANLKACPCRRVRYCSRECQVAHYRIHKKFCASRKKKQTG